MVLSDVTEREQSTERLSSDSDTLILISAKSHISDSNVAKPFVMFETV